MRHDRKFSSCVFKNIGACQFVNGDMPYGSPFRIGNARDEQDCARKVQESKPDAAGVSYKVSSKMCYAEFSSELKPGSSSLFRACVFEGNQNISDKIKVSNKTLTPR